MDRREKKRLTHSLAQLFPQFGLRHKRPVDMVTEQIAGRRVEYALSRHDNDTIPVVFENGLMAQLTEWHQVLNPLAKDTTTFAYNRPGYGRSDSVPTPRDGMHIVDELRVLLRAVGLNPPYVLVGHSLGGLYMQLFARRYPEEVHALVLVDATHPEQFKGRGAVEHWPRWRRAGFFLAMSRVEKAEFAGSNATGEHLLALPELSKKPVIILSAAKPLQDKSVLGEDGNEKRRDIVRLHPGATQIWADSSHHIHRECPEPIISAIRQVTKA